VVFVSFGPGCELDPGPEIVQKQLTIRGSWMFSVSTMMDALTVARSRAVGLDKVVTHTCGIEGAPQAIRAFEAGGAGKTVIVWDD
jgi:threonine dehydrogenase-like Zn-dependent dehydrogenase